MSCYSIYLILATIIWSCISLEAITEVCDGDMYLCCYSSFFLSLFSALSNIRGYIAAILAYKTMPGTKSFKKAVHLSIQFLALCLGLIGTWAALKFHNDKGIDNFYSLHSWLGLACILLFSIQVLYMLMLSEPSIWPREHMGFLSTTSTKWFLTWFVCSGEWGLLPSGILVAQEVAELSCFLGMYFSGHTYMLLPWLQR